MNAIELTDLDRREITLWRIVGRYDEARQAGDQAAMDRLMSGFVKRLADYERIAAEED